MPNRTNKNGFCIISYLKILESSILKVESAPPIATSITSNPINNIPKPIKNGAILFNFSLLVVKMIITPTKANEANTALIEKPPLLKPDKAKIKAVRVVPTFAPKINPAPCFTEIIFACAKPTVIIDDADDD